MLQVRVRLFALQRQQLGRRELTLGLPPGATIEDAWLELARLHPILQPARGSMRFARNGEYVDVGTGLADGDELALIPPVAGGADRRVRQLSLGPAPIADGDLAAMRAAVADPEDGAVVVFLGQTRVSPGTPAPGQEGEAARFAGQRVVGLEYEAYEPMALALLERIAEEIEARFDVRRLALRHRTGRVEVGEASVAIVVAAPHREQAFEACRYALEELKARVPIWKAERFADGGVWLGAPPREGPTA